MLDLFAGTGWGVACQRLGLAELGIEIMPAALATRRAAGMLSMDRSVAELPDDFGLHHPVHVGSPPCQTFSAAGKGAGRAALDRVLAGVEVISRGGRFRPDDGDPRTWLVLEPLRLALYGRPEVIVWEQVPGVLPVWQACARALRAAHGYSVWTGKLRSEQYGVPQTRTRAFLIARLAGPATPPTHTHTAATTSETRTGWTPASSRGSAWPRR